MNSNEFIQAFPTPKLVHLGRVGHHVTAGDSCQADLIIPRLYSGVFAPVPRWAQCAGHAPCIATHFPIRR